MPLQSKLLLIILDGVPWANWTRLMGNLEGWVQAGEAQRWRMRSVLPSISACCYASIHTGVPPQVQSARQLVQPPQDSSSEPLVVSTQMSFTGGGSHAT